MVHLGSPTIPKKLAEDMDEDKACFFKPAAPMFHKNRALLNMVPEQMRKAQVFKGLSGDLRFQKEFQALPCRWGPRPSPSPALREAVSPLYVLDGLLRKSTINKDYIAKRVENH